MKEKRETTVKNILAVFILIVIDVAIYKMVGKPIDKMVDKYIYASFIKEVILVAGAFIVMMICHKANVFKFKVRGIGEGLSAGLILIYTAFSGILGFFVHSFNVSVSNFEVVVFILQMFLVGVGEELLFRGILQNTLHEYWGEDSLKNVYKAIITAGILFGLTHFVNIFSGVSISATFFQVVSVLPVGVLLGTIYYRSNKNLWVCIIIHMLVDIGSFLTSGVLSGTSQAAAIDSSNDSSQIITMVIFIIVDLIVLRKSKMRKAMEMK